MMTKRLGAALMAAAAVAAVFTGSPSYAQPTDRGITVVLPVEPDSLDSCDTQTAQNANVTRGNLYQSLTHVSPEDGSVEPLLALSWERISDLEWEFKLRPDVKFHDGSDFTAEVAAANIARSQAGTDFYSGNLACYNSQQFTTPVASAAVDALTLRVTTEVPDAILPLRLTYIDMGSAATQELDEKITQPVGTGPYQFVERVQGERVTLTRFDGYWGDAPQVKDVTYVYRAEPIVRVGMIEAGEAQLAIGIRAEDASNDDRTVAYKDNRIFLMRAMTFKEPFLDPRVRMALSHAIDRDTIIPALMGITGSPWYQMLGPQVNGYIPGFDDTEAMRFDPDKARELLAAAAADGHPVETEFDIITRPDLFPGADEVVQAIAQNLADVGFKFRIMSMDTSAWLTYLRGPFPDDQRPTLQMISHDNTSGDASFSFPRYISCGGVVSATCNEKIDALLAEAETAETEERSRLYQEAARILYTEEGNMIGIAEQARLMMLGSEINYEPNPLSGIEILISTVTFKD